MASACAACVASACFSGSLSLYLYIYFSHSGYYVKHVKTVRIQLSSLRTKWLETAMARNIHFLGLFGPVQGIRQKMVALLGLYAVLKSFSTYDYVVN